MLTLSRTFLHQILDKALWLGKMCGTHVSPVCRGEKFSDDQIQARTS